MSVGPLAQLVEQWTLNPLAEGSSPSWPTRCDTLLRRCRTAKRAAMKCLPHVVFGCAWGLVACGTADVGGGGQGGAGGTQSESAASNASSGQASSAASGPTSSSAASGSGGSSSASTG